jgi:hypothetical protein
MWASYPLSTQLRVLYTTNNQFATYFNNYSFQINAYIFSTDTIPTVAYPSSVFKPQYGGQSGYASTISWSHNIQIVPSILNCLITSSAAADWFVNAGSTTIATTDYMIRAETNKSFDV